MVRHRHTCRFIGRTQLLLYSLDRCNEAHLLTTVPVAWLEKERNIPVVGGGQCQHPLYDTHPPSVVRPVSREPCVPPRGIWVL
jgi:hypothetical protein